MMKAAVARAFGDPEDVIYMVEDHPIPPPPKKGEMLVRVQACSLTPGDWRMLSGETNLIKKPKSWPYVPGLDICGIVEDVDSSDPNFKVGDEVIGTWSLFGMGGMAERAIVDTSLAAPKPASLSAAEAASLVNSSVHALLMVEKAGLRRGDRVLVIGGSGGIGSAVVQLARNAGAAFVAAVSTDEAMMKRLRVDRVVNYKEENFWEVPQFREEMFDVVFDCAVGVEAWRQAGNVLKSGKEGGRFVAGLMNEWQIICQHWWQMPGILLPGLSRQVLSSFGSSPKYLAYLGEVSADKIREVCELVETDKLRVILDPGSPLPFTEEGVRSAFTLLKRRGGHGKIVVEM